MNENNEITIESFQKISVPLNRRIYPGRMVDKLINVQPLIGAGTLIRYLKDAIIPNTWAKYTTKPYKEEVNWVRDGF